MSFLRNHWNQWPPRRRLVLLALAVWAAAILAAILLLRQDGVRAVLYKAF